MRMAFFVIFDVTEISRQASKQIKTMRKFYTGLVLFITAIGASGLSSCRTGCVHGSGNRIIKTRKVSGFTKLDVQGGYVVNLKQDSSGIMTITADDNLMDYIRSSVEDNTLHIFSRKNFCNKGPIVINIGISKLEELKGAGAVEFNTDTKINTQDLAIDLAGAGRVTLDLNAAKVSTTGSGSTEVNLKGQATSHTVNFTGSGKLNALDFVVSDYDIETTGASDCQINVLRKLTVNSTGSSDVEYRGNPSNVNTSKTGSSTVKKID